MAIITYAVIGFALSITGTFERLAVLSNVAVLLMYLLCCAACWFLVERDTRTDRESTGLNFPGMKIVPALAIAAIVWILGQASLSQSSIGNDTRAGLRLAVVVLAIASVLYFVRTFIARSKRANA
jgi:amino acid transporter